jgi:thioredoxin 1
MSINEGENKLSVKLNQVTDSTFASEVLESNVPVVVDFWAEWCQPCKALLSILEELQSEFANSVKFYSLNVDENSAVTAEYMVKSIPTLVFFKDGQVSECLVGNQTKDRVKNTIIKNCLTVYNSF